MRPSPLLLVLLLGLSCHPEETPKPPASLSWTAVEALVKQKDYAGARKELESLRAQHGDDPEILVRLAEVQRLGDDQAGAILFLRDAIAQRPDSAVLVMQLAKYYLLVKDARSARDTLVRARDAGLDTAEVALLLGSCLSQLGEQEAALAEFDRAGKLGAEAKVVHYNRGLVLGVLRRNAEARDEFEQAVRLDPEWARARFERAREDILLILGRSQAAGRLSPEDRVAAGMALDELVDLVDDLPEDWRLQESIGDAWMLLGDFDASLQAYTEALRLGRNPTSVEERYKEAYRRREKAQAGSGDGR